MKKIKVWEKPLTYIEIDNFRNEEEAREAWLLKHNKKSEISQTSRSLEMGMIRGAKKLNKNFK